MTVATLARDARESLAVGLEALQAMDAPPELLNVARPLAAAMGVLMDLEQAQAMPEDGAAPALDALREALRLLQCPEYSQYQASDDGMAAVARALGFVHELATTTTPQKAESSPPVPLPIMDVVLGPHTSSNFFKGLASGDVVDAGGLFVATYSIPPIGSKLEFRVVLPGNCSFSVAAEVVWTRDTSPAARGLGSSPGFGARLLNISEEARELARRYAKNREPIFYEDI